MIRTIFLILLVACGSSTLRAEDWAQFEWFARMRPMIKPEVSPLLSTQWGQNAPYNRFCPSVPGREAHCKTGCVATAMAQVMKFYNYPSHAQGTVSYQYQGDDGLPHTISLDIGQSVYRWDLMADTYMPADRRTAEEEEAVARLMADCGAAVSMDYGQYDSGAFDMDVPQAMTTHFDYDTAIAHLSAYEEHSDSLWFCTLYDQLSQGMPVIYGGITEHYGAHSFVVDGYDADGRFHVVYGLGGGDGYVNLKEIPYKYGRSMTYNIRPRHVANHIVAAPTVWHSTAVQARYAPDGTPLATPRRGLNLLKLADGSVRKIVVR